MRLSIIAVLLPLLFLVCELDSVSVEHLLLPAEEPGQLVTAAEQLVVGFLPPDAEEHEGGEEAVDRCQ